MTRSDPPNQLGNCKAFLVDLDGTIYLDDELLPGALDFLALLRERELPYVFLTNNSSKSARDYKRRLEGLSIEVAPGQILTSGDATIEYLLQKTTHRSAFLMGTETLMEDFEAAGFDLSTSDPDCVVAGFDTTIDYAKLERACTLLFAGKPYYATHPDRTCITQRGLVPDIAAIIAACEAVTRRTPKIIGKPQPEMVEVALARLGSVASETAMIGDQLDTDMEMARRSGLCPVLMMSGETTEAALAASPNPPAHVFENIAALATALRAL